MTTLTEIIKIHHPVLIDTSISNNSNFSERQTRNQEFGKTDKKLALQEIKDFQEFQQLLQHPNTYTIPEVTQEITNYTDKLRIRIEEISRIRIHSRGDKVRVQKIAKAKKQNKKKTKPLHQLQQTILETAEIARQKEIFIQDSGYQQLEEIIIELSKIHQKQETKPPYTDEKLATTLLYFAITEQTSPALITRDKKLCTLINSITKSLGSDVFLYHNDFFRQELNKQQPRVYLRRERSDSCTIALDIPEIEYPKGFRLNGISPIHHQKIRDSIGNFWKQYAEEPSGA